MINRCKHVFYVFPIILGIMASVVGCHSTNMPFKQDVNLAQKVFNYDTLLRKVDNIWYYDGKVFSGYRIEAEKDGKIVYQLPILEGVEEGTAKGWYNTGEKLMERRFINGKRQGQFIQWWPNGNCRYAFYFKDDVYHGKQEVFFPNGTKREESNYQSGTLDGVQQVWDEKGERIANYVIKNGKVYGVQTVKSCMPVAE